MAMLPPNSFLWRRAATTDVYTPDADGVFTPPPGTSVEVRAFGSSEIARTIAESRIVPSTPIPTQSLFGGSALSLDMTDTLIGTNRRWSLVAAPVGMTINETTGILSYTGPLGGAAPTTVIVRAANSQYSATTSFALSVSAIAANQLLPNEWTVRRATVNDPHPDSPAETIAQREGANAAAYAEVRECVVVTRAPPAVRWRVARTPTTPLDPYTIQNRDLVPIGGEWRTVFRFNQVAGFVMSYRIIHEAAGNVRVFASDDTKTFTFPAATVPNSAPTVTATDSLSGRTLTVSVTALGGSPTPAVSIAMTLDGSAVTPSGTGPWTYTVPSALAARTVAWTVTATNSVSSATSSGSEVVAPDQTLPGQMAKPGLAGGVGGATLTFGALANDGGLPLTRKHYELDEAGGNYSTPVVTGFVAASVPSVLVSPLGAGDYIARTWAETTAGIGPKSVSSDVATVTASGANLATVFQQQWNNAADATEWEVYQTRTSGVAPAGVLFRVQPVGGAWPSAARKRTMRKHTQYLWDFGPAEDGLVWNKLPGDYRRPRGRRFAVGDQTGHFFTLEGGGTAVERDVRVLAFEPNGTVTRRTVKFDVQDAAAVYAPAVTHYLAPGATKAEARTAAIAAGAPADTPEARCHFTWPSAIAALPQGARLRVRRGATYEFGDLNNGLPNTTGVRIDAFGTGSTPVIAPNAAKTGGSMLIFTGLSSFETNISDVDFVGPLDVFDGYTVATARGKDMKGIDLGAGATNISIYKCDIRGFDMCLNGPGEPAVRKNVYAGNCYWTDWGNYGTFAWAMEDCTFVGMPMVQGFTGRSTAGNKFASPFDGDPPPWLPDHGPMRSGRTTGIVFRQVPAHSYTSWTGDGGPDGPSIQPALRLNIGGHANAHVTAWGCEFIGSVICGSNDGVPFRAEGFMFDGNISFTTGFVASGFATIYGDVAIRNHTYYILENPQYWNLGGTQGVGLLGTDGGKYNKAAYLDSDPPTLYSNTVLVERPFAGKPVRLKSDMTYTDTSGGTTGAEATNRPVIEVDSVALFRPGPSGAPVEPGTVRRWTNGCRLTYNAQTANFVIGETVTSSGGATGVIAEQESDPGATGVILVNVTSGAFAVGQTLTAPSGGNGTLTAVGNGYLPVPADAADDYDTYGRPLENKPATQAIGTGDLVARLDAFGRPRTGTRTKGPFQPDAPPITTPVWRSFSNVTPATIEQDKILNGAIVGTNVTWDEPVIADFGNPPVAIARTELVRNDVPVFSGATLVDGDVIKLTSHVMHPVARNYISGGVRLVGGAAAQWYPNNGIASLNFSGCALNSTARTLTFATRIRMDASPADRYICDGAVQMRFNSSRFLRGTFPLDFAFEANDELSIVVTIDQNLPSPGNARLWIGHLRGSTRTLLTATGNAVQNGTRDLNNFRLFNVIPNASASQLTASIHSWVWYGEGIVRPAAGQSTPFSQFFDPVTYLPLDLVANPSRPGLTPGVFAFGNGALPLDFDYLNLGFNLGSGRNFKSDDFTPGAARRLFPWGAGLTPLSAPAVYDFQLGRVYATTGGISVGAGKARWGESSTPGNTLKPYYGMSVIPLQTLTLAVTMAGVVETGGSLMVTTNYITSTGVAVAGGAAVSVAIPPKDPPESTVKNSDVLIFNLGQVPSGAAQVLLTLQSTNDVAEFNLETMTLTAA